jgi:two-component system response regulator GlrR
MTGESSHFELDGVRILVVDDDQDMLTLLSFWLEGVGCIVRRAADGREALANAERERPDVVLTDLVMGEMDGLRLVSELHRQEPLLPVIMLSGQVGLADAMRAAHLGVSAFLPKPLERDGVLSEVSRVVRETQVSLRDGVFAPQVIRVSSAMDVLLSRTRRVAASECTVLITGPTGTGKELLAQSIHEGSARADSPLVSVNCSAIPEQLLESELFGHEKGAFTGAHVRHAGLFQAADGGTLFLDEIGDMPLTVQAKLLRVLQDFEVRPVGSTRSFPVDVRIISATHKDLEASVESREFREDLYYRLSVVPLEVPSLEERREDIAPLAEYFLDQFGRRAGQVRHRLAPKARELLSTASLPGNVRQLRNIIEQCVVLSASETISAEMVTAALRRHVYGMETLEEASRNFERRYLITVLRIAQGNVSNAARIAGRNRTEFYKLLSRHDMKASEFRD